jgi:hypothetical protein
VQRTFSISLLWVFAGKHWLPSRLCLAWPLNQKPGLKKQVPG